jgi:hypothetical protein
VNVERLKVLRREEGYVRMVLELVSDVASLVNHGPLLLLQFLALQFFLRNARHVSRHSGLHVLVKITKLLDNELLIQTGNSFLH